MGQVFVKSLLVGNKCDLKGATERFQSLESRFKETLPVVPISTKEKMNLDAVKQEIYRLLDIIRVYTKAPGREADFSEPVILKRGAVWRMWRSPSTKISQPNSGTPRSGFWKI